MSEEKPQGTNNNPIEEQDEDPPAIQAIVDGIVRVAGTTIVGATPPFVGETTEMVIGVIGMIKKAMKKSEDSDKDE